MRLACLVANVGNIVFVYILYDYARLFEYFSYWALQLTALFMTLALLANSCGYGVKALHHILFEMTFTMNLVVVCVYWSTLHEQSLGECVNDWEVINTYLTHSIPFISTALNFCVSDHVLRASHFKMLCVIGVVYGYVNYLKVLERGEPLYWFLTWEDMTSVYIMGGLIVAFSVVFVQISACMHVIKPRSTSTDHYKRL